VLVRALDSDVGSRRGVRGKEVVSADGDRQGEGGVWEGEGGGRWVITRLTADKAHVQWLVIAK
jgi:hypothetical protein